ncbi:MAG TPA: FAD-dependent oxidoreductase [Microbacterium sp.]|uniref:FAD-binding oxidoreductase n=1 Tax=Microbacterium sp. TaxID=51671 RepID=UPI002B8E2CC3|nr:FAD-dependent oxidoreductase [Microbacterium sp.]HWI30848.1 FAD-dependent oxidoreductase [Microbacterium sp.]
MTTATGTEHVRAASGNAWPALPAVLRDRAIDPAHPRYGLVRSSYMAVGSPLLVLMAERDVEVAAAVRYAGDVREAAGEKVPFSFRSGGHGMSGSSVNDGGIIVDISGMNRIEITDAERGLVRVQAGATWGDVAAALQPYDLALTSGNFGDTGVGGLATSGGVGFFIRSQGLTIDRIRGARIITADGSIHWVDEQHDPDLYWAVRGGGSQVGIATEFLFQAERLHSRNGDASVINQMAGYLVTDLPGFVESWSDWIRSAPREMVSFLMLRPVNDRRVSIQAINVWSGTDVDKATPVIESGAALGRLTSHEAFMAPYPRVVPTPRAQHTGQQHIRLRDVLVDQADRQLGAAFAESFAHGTTAMGELRSLGGAMSDVPEDATAWAGRHQEALAATWVQPHGQTLEDESFAPIRRLGTGAYGAYSSDTTPAAAELAWPGDTGQRLRRIAERVDPAGLFDQGIHLRRDAV